MRKLLFTLMLLSASVIAQQKEFYITANRIFDGETMHENWAVLVRGNVIVAVGPKDQVKAPVGATIINKPNSTLLPGLIEGHSHLLLYPYNITH